MMRILILLLLSAFPALAQTPPASPETSTVITSEMFRLDQIHHIGVFSGNVVVKSKDFHLTSRELTVYFTAPASAEKGAAASQPASRVERLVAKGEVHIESGNRTSTSAQADYTLADDKMILTGTPQVTQDKDVITGTTITLYRTANRMDVDGQSRVVLTGMDGTLTPGTAPAKTNPNP